MLNHITVMGRLTRDPELRMTQGGIPVASFAIACERDFGSRDDGSREVDFIDVVAWRNTADFVHRYFTKGRMAAVSGRLQIRKFIDRQGAERRVAEIVADSVYFGDSRPQDGDRGERIATAPAGPRNDLNGGETVDGYDVMDDDDPGLPF